MRKVAVLTILATFILVGCASLGLKPYTEMTPDQKALSFVKVYNKVFKGTFNQMLDGSLMSQAEKDQMLDDLMAGKITAAQVPIKKNLTAEQRTVINQKRVLLIKLKPYLDIYVKVVSEGMIPSAYTEEAILDLIDKLTALGTGV